MKSAILSYKSHEDDAPQSNLCYLAPNLGTFWLQGKKVSGQNASCATFVWNHGVGDVDMHCQKLTFKGILVTEGNVIWWHYTMPTRNEDGTETLVDILFESKKAGEQAKIFYRRDGKGTEVSPKDLPDNADISKGTGGFILWTWKATVFDGHEDA